MPFGYELVAAFADHPAPQLLYGQISVNQPAPSSKDDPLYVIFPTWNSRNYFVINSGYWDPHNGGGLPTGGEACLAVRLSPLLPMFCIQWGGVYQISS
jgi:hypothetical protein